MKKPTEYFNLIYETIDVYDITQNLIDQSSEARKQYDSTSVAFTFEEFRRLTDHNQSHFYFRCKEIVELAQTIYDVPEINFDYLPTGDLSARSASISNKGVIFFDRMLFTFLFVFLSNRLLRAFYPLQERNRLDQIGNELLDTFFHDIFSIDDVVSESKIFKKSDERLLLVAISSAVSIIYFIIAHELGHCICRHHTKPARLHDEYEADEVASTIYNALRLSDNKLVWATVPFGHGLMPLLYFDFLQLIDFKKRLQGSWQPDPLYPSPLERKKALRQKIFPSHVEEINLYKDYRCSFWFLRYDLIAKKAAPVKDRI